ncbi:hypothetical protein CHS0354_018586 [Potamilus streckersoni]|uniref:BHLH domain-containing protein n=1 Tax=Potamilus streckersoni TaxID=2493646 RepID=A0AAE0VPB3_9BIVA|nr:hypothetical protein CHS0354_018586 [Potamilus streckersoni]
MEVFEQDKLADSSALNEIRYNFGTFNPYSNISMDSQETGLSYQEYDWTRINSENTTRHLYSQVADDTQQYHSYLGYMPQSTDIAGSNYLPGSELGYVSSLSHLGYTGNENIYSPQSYGNVSPSNSTGSNGKPKRKRVQTSSQRKAANVRERRRMFHLNEAFDDLRKRLPAFNYEKRLSRIETLRLAITYIAFMKDVADGEDPNNVKLKTYKDIQDDLFSEFKDKLSEDSYE